jgi:hypothetical protein
MVLARACGYMSENPQLRVTMGRTEETMTSNITSGRIFLESGLR